MAKKDLLDTSKTSTVFESPLKLDKLVFSKKDNLWRAKIIVTKVEKMYDSIKTRISLNLEPFEETLSRLQREIDDAKAQPDLFDNSEVKGLQAEYKEEEKNMQTKQKEFGKIEFTAVIENLAQKDNLKTALTIFIPRDIIPMFMEKINLERDHVSKIEFYV